MTTKNNTQAQESTDSIVVSDASANNIDMNDGENGYIKIRVVTELGKYPLSGARVTVYASLEELVPVEITTTDSMGYAPVISLPVSYNPGISTMDPVYYYTTYHLSVNFSFYYPTAIHNIQVFPGITTEFNVNMTPVPSIEPNPYREVEILIPDIEL